MVKITTSSSNASIRIRQAAGTIAGWEAQGLPSQDAHRAILNEVAVLNALAMAHPARANEIRALTERCHALERMIQQSAG